MREYLAQVFHGDSRGGDQVMFNPQPQLPQDEHIPFTQQIQMLTHGASQGVLYRNDRTISMAGIQSIKDFHRTGAGQDLSFGQQLQCRLMAESTPLALNGYFHGLLNISSREQSRHV